MTATETAGLAGNRYSLVAIVLHWAIAALLLFEVALGLNMQRLSGSGRFAVVQLHKSVGITILLLILLRLLWRFRRQPPPLTATRWERTLALTVHALFYVLLLALPLSGWLIVSTSSVAVPTLLYGSVPWPHLPGFEGAGEALREAWHEAGEFIHANLVNVLYVLFALHLAGALKHHLLDRDGDLARMAPGAKAGSWTDVRLLAIVSASIAAVALGYSWAPTPGDSRARHTESKVPAAAVPEATVLAKPLPQPTETTQPEETTALPLSKWTISTGSTLRFRTTWGGETVAGKFSRFQGEILFSPDDLAGSEARILIDTSSASTGDASRDETLQGSDWFATSQHGKAEFTATSFRRTGPENFVAAGTLRLKGVTASISVPFSLRIQGRRALMEGSATVNRLTYKVGEGDFSSTTEIPAQVDVQISIQANRLTD